MQQDYIQFSTHRQSGASNPSKTGLIILNRPKALNALSFDMAVALRGKLEEWARDAGISHVVMAGSEPRAFCAGGDVRDLHDYAVKGQHDQIKIYFNAEYMADVAVLEFPKPLISLADGVVMGGGAGLMQSSSHAVVSDKTRFAMPESAIGLFPDAGASIFLGRCPRPLALLMGLTGRIIGAADCMLLGLARGVVPSERMQDLRARLLACTADQIDDVIADMRIDPGPAPLQAYRSATQMIFSGEDLAIMRDVAHDLGQTAANGTEIADFARQVHSALSTRCPMTMHVFLRLIDGGDDISGMIDALELDYHLAIRMTERADFIDGVRAVLIEKTNDAVWNPARLEDVTPAMVDAVFNRTGLARLR